MSINSMSFRRNVSWLALAIRFLSSCSGLRRIVSRRDRPMVGGLSIALASPGFHQ
jgi:hypothetical protein